MRQERFRLANKRAVAINADAVTHVTQDIFQGVETATIHFGSGGGIMVEGSFETVAGRIFQNDEYAPLA